MAEQYRTERITFLVTEEEAKKIEHEADKMTLSISAYCRLKALQQKIK